MIKIVQVGNAPIESEFKTTVACASSKSGCGATLELMAEDLRSFHYYGTHFKHEYVGIRCPCCSAIISVKDVPEPIRRKVFDRAASIFDGFDDRIY